MPINLSPNRSQPLLALILLMLLGLSPLAAEPRFFSVDVAPSWNRDRDRQGLWRYWYDEPFPLRASVSVGRLQLPIQHYLEGTLQLWTTQGDLTPTIDDDHLLCLIRPTEGDPIIKWVEWNDDLVAVTTFTFPVEHLDQAQESAADFMERFSLFALPEFSPQGLEQSAQALIKGHTNDRKELSDAVSVRQEMVEFRQEWAPLFTDPPALFVAVTAYLEARYDAAFVAAYGEEMGMPESLLAERLRSVENRKAELTRLLTQG